MGCRFDQPSYRRTAMIVSMIAVTSVAHPAQVDRETIQVSTHLVQVNVIVRDKNGPVTGLTKDDFVVKDRGKAQTIAFFAMETGRSAMPLVSPLPLNVFTNRPERKVGRA